MPLIDSPPDALSRVYAVSLFDLADKEGGRTRQEQIASEIEDLVELTREMPELSEFFASRILGTAEREGALKKMFSGRLSTLLLHFLLVVNRKERLNLFLSIAAAFDELIQEKFGRIEVDVYTKHELSRDQVNDIQSKLAQALGRDPVVHAYTDPSMLGGMRLQVGDKLIDASVSTMLRKMREQLKTKGSDALRARFDRLIGE
ncbi:MAG: ATP synthase F1 subunit delta [Planctomycetes bacterium]|nr:ATP synthase F1 subunit delta [Planctomycetota bacterium]